MRTQNRCPGVLRLVCGRPLDHCFTGILVLADNTSRVIECSVKWSPSLKHSSVGFSKGSSSQVPQERSLSPAREPVRPRYFGGCSLPERVHATANWCSPL